MQHFRTVTVQMLHSQMNAGMIRFISLKCLLLQMTFGKKKKQFTFGFKTFTSSSSNSFLARSTWNLWPQFLTQVSSTYEIGLKYG